MWAFLDLSGLLGPMWWPGLSSLFPSLSFSRSRHRHTPPHSLLCRILSKVNWMPAFSASCEADAAAACAPARQEIHSLTRRMFREFRVQKRIFLRAWSLDFLFYSLLLKGRRCLTSTEQKIPLPIVYLFCLVLILPKELKNSYYKLNSPMIKSVAFSAAEWYKTHISWMNRISLDTYCHPLSND